MNAANVTPSADSEQIQNANDLEERIRRRAYELYETYGKEDGHDLEHWLQAESETINQSESKQGAAAGRKQAA